MSPESTEVIELIGVDQADRIRPARFCRPGRIAMSVMLGVSFTITGMRVYCFAPAGDHLDIFGHLPDGGAHAALAHPVRAAEIQLDPISARSPQPAAGSLPAASSQGTISETTTRAVG